MEESYVFEDNLSTTIACYCKDLVKVKERYHIDCNRCKAFPNDGVARIAGRLVDMKRVRMRKLCMLVLWGSGGYRLGYRFRLRVGWGERVLTRLVVRMMKAMERVLLFVLGCNCSHRCPCHRQRRSQPQTELLRLFGGLRWSCGVGMLQCRVEFASLDVCFGTRSGRRGGSC